MKPLFILIIIVCSGWSRLAIADSPPSYNLRLVTIQETGEVVAVIEGSGFMTVDSLKRYITDVLPAGATIQWRAADTAGRLEEIHVGMGRLEAILRRSGSQVRHSARTILGGPE
ncbi:MAG: hypothetical protein M3463_18215 [Verrucomicrobiota bacterium]|nr:hypothetical protein [Verrucomicrobiota bacterium]